MISAFLSTSAEPEFFDEIPDEQELFFPARQLYFLFWNMLYVKHRSGLQELVN